MATTTTTQATPSLDFTKKVTLITGAASGIGLATALLFLEAGAHVYAVDRLPLTPESPLQAHASSPDRFHFHQGDLTTPGIASELISSTCSHFKVPQIDILLNIAGLMDNYSSVGTLEEERFDRVIAVNLKAPVFLMSAAVKQWSAIKHRGVIVNVVSVAGHRGGSAGVAYTASKHALVGATKQTAFRYRWDGIRCNAIAPGAVKTPILQNSGIMNESFQPSPDLDMDTFQLFQAVTGLAKPTKDQPWFEPVEIANAVLFVASERASMINGVVLDVDAGWSAM